MNLPLLDKEVGAPSMELVHKGGAGDGMVVNECATCDGASNLVGCGLLSSLVVIGVNPTRGGGGGALARAMDHGP